MSHRDNKEPLDRFWTCLKCGHSNHKSRVQCHHCDAIKEPLVVFKEVDPDVRDYIIQALEPVIERLQLFIDEDLQRYVLTSTKRDLKPMVDHLQHLVDVLTPMPKLTDKIKNRLLKRKKK